MRSKRTRRRRITTGVRDLTNQLREAETKIATLADDLQAARLARRAADDQNKQDIERQGAHIGVLQGDRDALTRTIEVLSRRLASPGADKDPARAGWRAMQVPRGPSSHE